MPRKLTLALLLTPILALAVTPVAPKHPGEQLVQHRTDGVPLSGFVYDKDGDPVANIDILAHYIDDSGGWTLLFYPARG